jgi:hypothetical protein
MRTQPDGSFDFADAPQGQSAPCEGQLVLDPTLADQLENFARQIDAVNARLDRLNDQLDARGRARQHKIDHVRAARQKEEDEWALAEKIDEVRRYRDKEEAEEEAQANAPSGLARLIGLGASFAAGWNIGGTKK